MMRKVLVAYDTRMLKDKEDFLHDLCRIHGVSYDWGESYGNTSEAKYMALVQFSCSADNSIVTKIVTLCRKDTLTNWWGYKGPILPAALDNYDIGGL